MIGAPAAMFSTTNAETFAHHYSRQDEEGNQQAQNIQMFNANAIDANLERILAPPGGQDIDEKIDLATITAIW